LTKDEFADALIKAHKRGVEVKALIDNAQAGNQYADDEKLENEGIEVRRDKASGLMHNKFAVIDDLIVYTGSYNHTKGGNEDNDENYIIIKDIGIAHIFETQFQKLREKHK
jgi:phosphatidylserine/phosphatidylglycerophosphate/cardiolipin synthase-like enzyme